MSTKKETKVTLALRVQGLIAGTQKHASSGPLTLEGVAYTPAELAQVLQSLSDAIAKADATKADWKDALKSMRDTQAKVGPLLQAYKSWLVATHGKAPAILADYGLAPPKARTPQTADQKAAAVAKRKATRDARHTAGPKQKAKIKGTVPTPATAGSPAPAPATPAQATPTAASSPIPKAT